MWWRIYTLNQQSLLIKGHIFHNAVGTYRWYLALQSWIY